MNPRLYYILIGVLIGQSIVIWLLQSLNRRQQRTIIAITKLYLKSIAMNSESYFTIFKAISGKKFEGNDDQS